jgi:hypothetical protein
MGGMDQSNQVIPFKVTLVEKRLDGRSVNIHAESSVGALPVKFMRTDVFHKEELSFFCNKVAKEMLRDEWFLRMGKKGAGQLETLGMSREDRAELYSRAGEYLKQCVEAK